MQKSTYLFFDKLAFHLPLNRLLPWACGLLILLIAACSPNEPISTAQEDTSPPDPADAQAAEVDANAPTSTGVAFIEVDLASIPLVDQTKHTVPLEEIYFDTFRRVDRIVPLPDISPDMVKRLLDAIPPIYNPKFETNVVAEVWLADTDIVLGYADGGEAYAYPIKILNWHEMVSHTVNGRPILATY